MATIDISDDTANNLTAVANYLNALDGGSRTQADIVDLGVKTFVAHRADVQAALNPEEE